MFAYISSLTPIRHVYLSTSRTQFKNAIFCLLAELALIRYNYFWLKQTNGEIALFIEERPGD